MKHILEVDSVILEFDAKRILQSVYMKNETGRITGVLGRNGTGKSCLMQIIFGELIPSYQSVRINGETLITPKRSPLDMRYLPQDQFVPGSFTIERVFHDFQLDVCDFLSVFPDFAKYAKSKMKNLSGGERRIVEIYIILVSQTKFCMLDEPFSQIMPIHVDSIKKLILREKENKGVIVTDHMYRHILDVCDDLYVINNGETYLTKSVDDLQKLGYTR